MLIAYRCRKDFSQGSPSTDCPSTQVQERLKLEPWGERYYCPSTHGPELNTICMNCLDWEPAHDKPPEKISDDCRLSETHRCPSWPEVRRGRFSSPWKVPQMDAVCRTCRLFAPSGLRILLRLPNLC